MMRLDLPAYFGERLRPLEPSEVAAVRVVREDTPEAWEAYRQATAHLPASEREYHQTIELAWARTFEDRIITTED